MKKGKEFSYAFGIENKTNEDIIVKLLPEEQSFNDAIFNYDGVRITNLWFGSTYKQMCSIKNIKPFKLNSIILTSVNIVRLISKISICKTTVVDKNEFTREPFTFLIPPRQNGNLSVLCRRSFILDEKSYLEINIPANETFILYLNESH